MCSKTQCAVCRDGTTWCDSKPCSVSEMASPGLTSRTSSAPMMSNAQLSDATHQWSPSLPRASGRTPWGSRNATTARFVITTVEYAPSSRGITAATAFSMGLASLVERSAAMISESEVPRKERPSARSSLWRATALVRLPLWASATSRPSSRQTGWLFSQEPPPVVE